MPLNKETKPNTHSFTLAPLSLSVVFCNFLMNFVVVFYLLNIPTEFFVRDKNIKTVLANQELQGNVFIQTTNHSS